VESRGDPFGCLLRPESQTVPETLHNRRITFTAIQRSDVRSGTLDPRGATPADVGRSHSVVITLKSDHSTCTVDGTVSNHSAGRATDIGAVAARGRGHR